MSMDIGHEIPALQMQYDVVNKEISQKDHCNQGF